MTKRKLERKPNAKNLKYKIISTFNEKDLSFQLFPHFLRYRLHLENIRYLCSINIIMFIYVAYMNEFYSEQNTDRINLSCS